MLGNQIPWLKDLSGPFFLYDRAALAANAARLRELWKPVSAGPSHLFYSVKANPNPRLLGVLKHMVDGFDVSSERELRLALRLVPGERITLSGPKTDSTLKLALKSGLRSIHCDSREEVEIVEGTSHTLRLADRRLPTRKLGLTAGEIVSMATDSTRGLHMYLGRESFAPDRLREALEELTNLLTRLKIRDPHLYIGAGIPSWTVFDSPPALAPFHADGPVHLEAGRAIVSSAGYYGAKILAVKPGETPLVQVDGGIHPPGGSLLSPVHGARGLACSAYREGNRLEDELQTFQVYGSLCLPNDALHPRIELPRGLRRGDWLVFSPCGAYGLTASANQFIGQTWPWEFLFDSSRPKTLERPTDIGVRMKSYIESFTAEADR